MSADGFVVGILSRNQDVFVAGDTESAVDFFQVETNIVRFFLAELPVDVERQLLTTGTRQTMPTPDLTQRVYARVASSVNGNQAMTIVGIVAHRLLNGCHLFGRQRFVEVRFEIGL